MILCKHCGFPVNEVLCSCFTHEGADSEASFPVEEPAQHPGVAEFFVPTSWTGYDLTTEEQAECILCPHCRKFPFDEKAGINVQTLVSVVCFEEGVECE